MGFPDARSRPRWLPQPWFAGRVCPEAVWVLVECFSAHSQRTSQRLLFVNMANYAGFTYYPDFSSLATVTPGYEIFSVSRTVGHEGAHRLIAAVCVKDAGLSCLWI